MITIEEFAATPLGRDMHRKYGWDRAVWRRLAWYGCEIGATAGRLRGTALRGHAARRMIRALLREFGATAAELARVERAQDRRLGCGSIPERLHDLLYCATVLGLVHGRGETPAPIALGG